MVACAAHQYRCAGGQCVSEGLRCDGYADCSDHSDELNCVRPPRCPAQLRCPNSHECLQKEWLCDGEEDCKDGSDEKVTARLKESKQSEVTICTINFLGLISVQDCETQPVKCRNYQWQCGDSSQCIPLPWRCDGKEDCHNGVDEDKCEQISSQMFPTDQVKFRFRHLVSDPLQQEALSQVHLWLSTVV